MRHTVNIASVVGARRAPAMHADRRRTVLWAAGVMLVVLAGTTLIARYGLRLHALVVYDEKYSIEGARYFHDDPARLLSLSGFAGRGLERLTALVLTPIGFLWHRTADQFAAAHVLIAACFAAVAAPTYGFGRDLRLPRGWALAAGALAVFCPWALLATTFLNTALATTTAVAAVWAIWRSTARPSLRADALALALLGVTTLARVSDAAFLVAWILAVAVQAWRDAPASAGFVARLRRWPAFAIRAHPLLAGVIVAVAALIAVKGLHAFIGSYPAPLDLPLRGLWERLKAQIAHEASGMALVPLIIAVPWLVRTAVMPRSRDLGAFAVVVLAAYFALLYVNHAAGLDERYDLPMVALLFVAFVAAMAGREIGIAGVLVAGALVWHAMHRWGVVSVSEAVGTYAPAVEWFSRVWLGTLSETLPLSPRELMALLVAGATAAAVAVALLRGRAQAAVAWGVTAAVLGIGVAGAVYTLQHFTNRYRPQADFRQLSFVDEATDGNAAQPLVNPLLADPAVANLWTEVQFFNSSLRRPLSFGARSYPLCCGRRGAPSVLRADPRTGALSVRPGSMPRYVLTTPDWVPIGLATTVVATSSVLGPPARVERLVDPPTTAWLATGLSGNGWVVPGRAAALRVYGATAGTCLHLTLRAPRLARGRTRWRVGPARGVLASTQARRVQVSLPAGRGSRPAVLDMHATPAGTAFDGTAATLGLTDVRRARCGATDTTAR